MTQKLAQSEWVDRHAEIVEELLMDRGTEEHEVGRVIGYPLVQLEPGHLVFGQPVILRTLLRRVRIEGVPEVSPRITKPMKPHGLMTPSAS